MNRIAVLFTALCCLFVSCQKEGGNSSVDGTTWSCEGENNGDYTLILNDGYASLYFKYRTSSESSFLDTQAYTVKGNTIKFKGHLHEDNDPIIHYIGYYNKGTFNEDRSRLTLNYHYEVNDPDNPNRNRIGDNTYTYIRVLF